MKTTTTLY